MENRDYLIILYDYYGELLSEDNKRYFEDYYLAEIAENNNVSRNNIHKHLKSSEEKLLFFEEKLKLYKKDLNIELRLKNIKDEKIRKEVEKILN